MNFRSMSRDDYEWQQAVNEFAWIREHGEDDSWIDMGFDRSERYWQYNPTTDKYRITAEPVKWPKTDITGREIRGY